MNKENLIAHGIRCIVPIGMFLGVRELAKLFYNNFVVLAARGGFVVLGFDFGTLRTDADILIFLQNNSILFTAFCNLLCIALFVYMFRREVPAKYGKDRILSEAEFITGQMPLAPLPAFQSIIAVVCVSVVANNIISISGLSRFSTNYNAYQEILGGRELVILLVTHCIIAPIAEELCLRGLTFRRMVLVMGKWPAILVSALCFGIVHGNLVQGVYGFIVGIFLAYFYYHTGNIIVPILAHMGVNLLATLMSNYGVMNWMYTNQMVFWGANIMYISITAMIFNNIGKVKK